MKENEQLGDVSREGEQVTLRYVRGLRHAPEKVWAALTESEHLRAWMPVDLVGERAARAQLVARFWPDFIMKYGMDEPELPAEIVVWDPPKTLAWTWDEDLLRFELEATESSTRLTFTTKIDTKQVPGHKTAAIRTFQPSRSRASRSTSGRPGADKRRNISRCGMRAFRWTTPWPHPTSRSTSSSSNAGPCQVNATPFSSARRTPSVTNAGHRRPGTATLRETQSTRSTAPRTNGSTVSRSTQSTTLNLRSTKSGRLRFSHSMSASRTRSKARLPVSSPSSSCALEQTWSRSPACAQGGTGDNALTTAPACVGTASCRRTSVPSEDRSISRAMAARAGHVAVRKATPRVGHDLTEQLDLSLGDPQLLEAPCFLEDDIDDVAPNLGGAGVPSLAGGHRNHPHELTSQPSRVVGKPIDDVRWKRLRRRRQDTAGAQLRFDRRESTVDQVAKGGGVGEARAP